MCVCSRGCDVYLLLFIIVLNNAFRELNAYMCCIFNIHKLLSLLKYDFQESLYSIPYIQYEKPISTEVTAIAQCKIYRQMTIKCSDLDEMSDARQNTFLPNQNSKETGDTVNFLFSMYTYLSMETDYKHHLLHAIMPVMYADDK